MTGLQKCKNFAKGLNNSGREIIPEVIENFEVDGLRADLADCEDNVLGIILFEGGDEYRYVGSFALLVENGKITGVKELMWITIDCTDPVDLK